jgi:hypothetical protein
MINQYTEGIRKFHKTDKAGNVLKPHGHLASKIRKGAAIAATGVAGAAVGVAGLRMRNLGRVGRSVSSQTDRLKRTTRYSDDLGSYSMLDKVGHEFVDSERVHHHNNKFDASITHAHGDGNTRHEHPDERLTDWEPASSSLIHKIGRGAWNILRPRQDPATGLLKKVLGRSADIGEPVLLSERGYKMSEQPTVEYVEKVKASIQNHREYSDELAEVLASNCWNNNWPFDKSYFESDEIKFSDDDSTSLDNYIQTIESYVESLDTDEYSEYDETEGYSVDAQGKHTHSAKEGKGAVKHSHDEGSKPHSHAEKESNMSDFSGEVTQALGLRSNASAGEVISAISAIQASQFSSEERDALATLHQERMVSQYMEHTEGLTVIPGTTRERAEKLANMEEEDAVDRLREWRAFQESTEKAGVTQTLLQSGTRDNVISGPATKQFAEYSEKLVKDDDTVEDANVALARMAINDPEAFGAYHAEQLEN